MLERPQKPPSAGEQQGSSSRPGAGGHSPGDAGWTLRETAVVHLGTGLRLPNIQPVPAEKLTGKQAMVNMPLNAMAAPDLAM